MTTLIGSLNHLKLPTWQTRGQIYQAAVCIGGVFKLFPQYRMYGTITVHSVSIIGHSDMVKNIPNTNKLKTASHLVTIASCIVMIYAQIYSYPTLFITPYLIGSAGWLYTSNFDKAVTAITLSHASALLLNSWKFSLLGTLIMSARNINSLSKQVTSNAQKVITVSAIITSCLLCYQASQEEPLELWKLY